MTTKEKKELIYNALVRMDCNDGRLFSKICIKRLNIAAKVLTENPTISFDEFFEKINLSPIICYPDWLD